MAQTIIAQACTAIMEALNASGAPATFYRARFEAMDAEETAGNLYPTKIDCKYDCGQDSVKLDATAVVRVSTSATALVDLAVDPVILWAWRQIRFDHTLGQLVEDVYIDNIEIGYLDKSTSDQVCADITIRVEVEVDRNDPSINRTWMANLAGGN